MGQYRHQSGSKRAQSAPQYRQPVQHEFKTAPLALAECSQSVLQSAEAQSVRVSSPRHFTSTTSEAHHERDAESGPPGRRRTRDAAQ